MPDHFDAFKALRRMQAPQSILLEDEEVIAEQKSVVKESVKATMLKDKDSFVGAKSGTWLVYILLLLVILGALFKVGSLKIYKQLIGSESEITQYKKVLDYEAGKKYIQAEVLNKITVTEERYCCDHSNTEIRLGPGQQFSIDPAWTLEQSDIRNGGIVYLHGKPVNGWSRFTINDSSENDCAGTKDCLTSWVRYKELLSAPKESWRQSNAEINKKYFETKVLEYKEIGLLVDTSSPSPLGVYVNPGVWNQLTIDQKELIASILAKYKATHGLTEMVRIQNVNTGETLAKYDSTFGLQLADD